HAICAHSINSALPQGDKSIAAREIVGTAWARCWPRLHCGRDPFHRSRYISLRAHWPASGRLVYSLTWHSARSDLCRNHFVPAYCAKHLPPPIEEWRRLPPVIWWFVSVVKRTECLPANDCA